MYVVLFPPYPWVDMSTMSHLLMIIQEILGYISWITRVNCSGNSNNFQTLDREHSLKEISTQNGPPKEN